MEGGGGQRRRASICPGMRRTGRSRVRPRREVSSRAVFAAAAGVGAAAVLGVALGAVLSRTAPAPPPVSPPSAAPSALWEAERWYRDAYGRAVTAAECRAMIAEGRARGYDRLAEFAWESRVRSLEERIRALEAPAPSGDRVAVTEYPDFWTVFRRFVHAESVPDETGKTRVKFEERIPLRLDAEGRPAKVTLPRSEFEELRRALDAFVKHEEERRADPTHAAIQDALARLERDPVLGRFRTVHRHVHPFVLFYASRELVPKDDSPVERARVENRRRDLAARLASRERLVRDFLAFFEETWRKPLGLPEFGPLDLLYVWIFDERNVFDEYRRAAGQPLTPGIVGFFDRRVRWTFVYEDWNQPMLAVETLAHELIHHLHWHFSEDPESVVKNHMEHLDAVWFTEGWAEYAGAVATDGEGYRFGQNSRDRMDRMHACRRLQLPLPPLRFLLARADPLDWARSVGEFLERKRPDLPEAQRAAALLAYRDVLYAQSWLFVKFLHEHEGGRYREAAVRFVGAALRGFQGFEGAKGYPRSEEVLGELLGLKSAADWQRFEREFDAFVESKLYEIPPR